ncbi:hypothetical protein DFH09DRAFT_1023840 [Mycena vulgaris]|nr:hypothetical protein DFH09DRAFT_1023840 [Mycena vulgaris]
MLLPSLQTVDLDEDGCMLWPLIISAEKEALANRLHAKYNDDLIGARVLGFFVLDFWERRHHSLGIVPYKCLILEINCALSTKEREEPMTQHKIIYELGLFYRNHLMRVFRSDGGPVSVVSEHPSPPSLDQVRVQVVVDMANAPKTKLDAKKHALVRDGYRCTLTGDYDFDSCMKHPELLAKARATGQALFATGAAYIFSELAQDDDKGPEYAASALAILKMFGLGDVVDDFLGDNVNNPSNIFTMSVGLHQFFDRLEFWLEEIPEQSNTYKICASNGAFFGVRGVPPPQQRIKFEVAPEVVAACKARDITVPALPSHRLLAIRAACARVAHLSGATEQIDQTLHDAEETAVMANDGTTADLLTSLLLQSSNMVDTNERVDST